MAHVFNTVGLIGKFGDPTVAESLNTIARELVKRGLRVLIDEDTANVVSSNGYEVASRRIIGRQADLAIVMGGDGTLLNAGRSLVDFQVPVVGVNLGRLGFLADVSPDEIPGGLDEILCGNYREESRLLLHAEVVRDGRAVTQSTALNDIVVHKKDVARMIEVDAYVDGQFLNAYRADGLILSTPTGSTAYALSGGGPIIHPVLEVVELVPICPHTLTHRPIVLGAESDIEVRVGLGNTTHIQVTCDGQVSLEILPGDVIRVRRKRRKLRLIHPRKHDYFQLLRAKLRWGATPENDLGTPSTC